MNNTGNISDDLIRDHFLTKGYKNSFKHFESELKAEKDAKLQVEPFVEETLSAIEKLDIDRLRTLWDSWNSKIFNRLSGVCNTLQKLVESPVQERARAAKQYENEVYRLFLVRCVQKNNISKCSEFFQKMSAHTQNNPAWTDWFAFPYNPNPQDGIFRKYFDKQWREIFVISLHNFVSIASRAAQPSQLSYIVEEMQFGNEKDDAVFEEEFIDDFAVIAQCVGPMKVSSSKPSLKNLFKSFTGSSKRSTD